MQLLLGCVLTELELLELCSTTLGDAVKASIYRHLLTNSSHVPKILASYNSFFVIGPARLSNAYTSPTPHLLQRLHGTGIMH